MDKWEKDFQRPRVKIGWWIMGYPLDWPGWRRVYYFGQYIAGLVICDSCNGVGGVDWFPCSDCGALGKKTVER